MRSKGNFGTTHPITLVENLMFHFQNDLDDEYEYYSYYEGGPEVEYIDGDDDHDGVDDFGGRDPGYLNVARIFPSPTYDPEDMEIFKKIKVAPAAPASEEEEQTEDEGVVEEPFPILERGELEFPSLAAIKARRRSGRPPPPPPPPAGIRRVNPGPAAAGLLPPMDKLAAKKRRLRQVLALQRRRAQAAGLRRRRLGVRGPPGLAQVLKWDYCTYP